MVSTQSEQYSKNHGWAAATEPFHSPQRPTLRYCPVAATRSRSSADAASRPLTASTFSLDLAPTANATSRFFSPSSWAMYSAMAAFAWKAGEGRFLSRPLTCTLRGGQGRTLVQHADQY